MFAEWGRESLALMRQHGHKPVQFVPFSESTSNRKGIHSDEVDTYEWGVHLDFQGESLTK